MSANATYIPEKTAITHSKSDMLSICIPTFERPAYLKWTIKKLRVDFPHAQITVSDNDPRPFNFSTRILLDELGSQIDYIQQKINLGPFPNMLAALSMAQGRYAVYCADDDYLLPEQVAIAIAYLDAHPEIAAYCAPCEIWNEIEGTPYWNAFKVPRETTFGPTQGMDLFNFIIDSHVWPEHIIYRTPVPLKPRIRAYWAFADLPDILERGAIHFSPTPFYRNLLVHPVGEREQLGNVQCLTHFDEYRAGLEVLACGLFGQQPYATRQRIQEMIASFICSRLDVAARLYERSGDMENALMLRKRLMIADPRRDAT